MHRSPHKRAYPDTWDLPGGHREAGESELGALRRELHEEHDDLGLFAVEELPPLTHVIVRTALAEAMRGHRVGDAPG